MPTQSKIVFDTNPNKLDLSSWNKSQMAEYTKQPVNVTKEGIQNLKSKYFEALKTETKQTANSSQMQPQISKVKLNKLSSHENYLFNNKNSQTALAKYAAATNASNETERQPSPPPQSSLHLYQQYQHAQQPQHNYQPQQQQQQKQQQQQHQSYQQQPQQFQHYQHQQQQQQQPQYQHQQHHTQQRQQQLQQPQQQQQQQYPQQQQPKFSVSLANYNSNLSSNNNSTFSNYMTNQNLFSHQPSQQNRNYYNANNNERVAASDL
jgi:hypothetical protein